ncbi:MAG: oxygen-insensitive NADPH nitroreductase [Actinomycetota bacterium]|nr:oxygen-insensitive NADPH nitroreductase [Actinomycetota bacterium]
MNDVFTLLRSHRSIRKFTDEAVDDDTVAAIVACGTSAATSSNLQATTVIRVRDRDTRAEIARIAGGQQHIVDCPVFLVWCADVRRPGTAAALAGATLVSGMTEQFIIATVDVALAAQNAVVAAESLGLGICYIGAIRNDPQPVSELLDLPEHVYPVFGLCIGHPAQDPDVKPRLPIEVVLKEERYSDDSDEFAIKNYDETMRDYYRTRTGGTKNSCWSDEMAGLVGSERRAHMRRFLADRGFEMR